MRATFGEVRALAAGRWLDILSRLGISRDYLKRRHRPCPTCGGKDRFRFDDKNGTGSFYCNNCGAGDGFRLLALQYGLSSREVLTMVANLLDVGSQATIPRKIYPPRGTPEFNSWALRQLERTWSASLEVSAGDPVHRYLTQTRKLTLPEVPRALRFHPGLEYREDEKLIGTFPAMVAPVIAPNGKAVSIHRTYLTVDGKKASVPSPKKLMTPTKEGATRGAAIRLFEPDTRLGIAEGIETALACNLASFST